jgi:hypothetical protein
MNKCRSSRIVLDQPCPNPFCPGEHSDSMGALCWYCATNQRDAALPTDAGLDFLVSSLGDLAEYGQEVNEYAQDA